MTQPVQPRPATHPHAFYLMIIAAILAILASFAAGGEALGGIPAWTWGFASFAAVYLAWSGI
jgi:hypothetical protein